MTKKQSKKSRTNEENPARKGRARDGQPNVEGEGSYEGTRRYDEGVARTLEERDVEQLGRDAAEALQGPEGDALREAERQARERD
jgi:hypothetical protein